jgi:hypothetical protein
LREINNFWQFADSLLNRLPGWPTEKQLVMLTTFAMGFMMLIMAQNNMALWNIELFKTLITVVIVTGCVNMVLAFYFTANKSDETRSANTAKAFEAITATAQAAGSSTDSNVIREGDDVTLERK